MPAVAPQAGLPSRLGKYELLMPLAAGGMARIYIGRSTGIGQFERHVVLKMITPDRANDQVAINMFLDEARLAASLNHQNVAQVFEVGEDQSVHYLAMEYVHGQDLRALLAKAGSQGTRIPLELALTVVAGAAAGLHHAHERRGPDGVPLGIVHRDVSPSNIMIGYDGAVKLLDFGIAKATSRSVETQSGIIKGKFAYMAPEQCRGRDVDRRSDVFSLGIILYEISTQHRCFRADSDFDTMHRIVTGDVVRPTRLVQGYPQALEAIVMKALAIDAAQRYQSAGALLEALEAFAVSNRMSLSTMGLGRFMRDMFGEVQEPWLNTAATKVMQPLAAKENTISSTNGKGAAAKIEAPEHLDPDDDINGIPDEDGAFPDSGGVAMQTILDLPRGNRPETAEPQQADWNAKSYPPTGAPDDLRNFPTNPMPMSGGGMANLHSPIGQMPLPAPQTITPPVGIQHQTLGIQPHLPANPPLGTQPMGTVPPGPRSDLTPVPHAFQTPSSGTGPPLPPQAGQPIVSTKHGYASAAMSRGDVSYPGYAVPQDAFTPDVQLKPNRRPLFIGLGLAIVGIIVILAVSFSGKDVEKAPSAPPDEGSATETNMQTTTPPPTTNTTNTAPDENMISIVVDSEPHGADVLIAGTKIGTTPFNKQLKKGTNKVDLKVHMDGYADFTTKIDTAANYENPKVRLSKVDDANSAQPANGSSTDSTTTPSNGSTTDSGSTSTSGVSSKTGTQTTATGTKTTNTTGTKTGGTTTTTGTKSGTGTKTGGTTTTSSTGTKTGTSSGTKTNTGSGGTKTTTSPKCQPPDHVDPFSNVPICPAK